MKLKYQLQNKSLVLVTFLLMIMLVSCGDTEGQADQATEPAVQTSAQLAWVHNIEFIGFYGAVKEDFYTKENLDVTLLGGGFGDDGNYIDPVGVVVSGKADFGVAGADVLLRARAEGHPVVGVASIYQRSPVVLISLKEKGIATPRDLLGKRVLVEPIETTVGVAYYAFLATQNISSEDINEIPRTDFTVDPIFGDESDVVPGFITNEALQAKNRGEVNLILMSDYNVDIYSNVIFTTKDMIQNKPELVEAFVRATIQGMQWAVDNPEDAAQYVVDTYGEMLTDDVKNAQLPGMKSSLPLLNPAGSKPGMMSADAWENTHKILLDQGILNEPLDIDAAYTLTFIQKIYK